MLAKKTLADFFGVNARTIQNWQDKGMSIARGGGKQLGLFYVGCRIVHIPLTLTK